MMYIHRKVLLAITIVVVVGAAAILTIATSRAQTTYVGPTYEYKELTFTEPVTFGTNVFAGYFDNGKFITPQAGNENVTAGDVIMYFSGQGWELKEQNSSQVFYFQRQKP
ncbi:MAG: hypothetical protein JXD22_17010 [Sedimentisphaerales bacterium]|nr:hypothetical protein [Sedimentisphaerales bacterium]